MHQHKFLLYLILIGFVLLAWAYGLVMPPFENLDEIEHFAAIRYVADTGSLPVHDPAVQERYRYRQEASQPPLYYILMGGLTRLLRLSTGDANSYLVSNPFVACGPSDHPYNRHTLYHNPSQQAFPWDGALMALHLLRAIAPLLQLVTIAGVYAIARLVFPQRPQVAPLAAALTAFNPQFLSVASGVNNDNLVTPLATLGLYLALLTRQRGLSLQRSTGLGALAGLAGLSKLSGLLLLILVGFVLLEIIWRSRQHPTPNTQHPILNIFFHGMLIGLVATSVCGWWFWRNWQLYGDPTALQPMLDLVGRRASDALPWNESGLMFRSFWGQLACAFFSDRFYLFVSSLTAVGLGGLSWGLWCGEERQSRTRMLYLALWFGITYAGWLRWGAVTAATGGRLLFPAIAATSTLLAYGLLRLWPAAWRGWATTVAVALLAAFALATLRWELRPLFAPPRTFAENDLPAISHPLEATFGSTIGLLGYDAEIDSASPKLDVTLYWQALAPIPQDYALAIQLTSPIPGDDSLRFNYNTWPGRGNYPTSAWPLGRVIADGYHFRLPASDAPTQAWDLHLALYRKETGERLPVQLGETPVGDQLVLARLRALGRSPACPEDGRLAQEALFGEAVVLTHASVLPGPKETNVVLCWNVFEPLPVDYTVFVHLYDAAGTLTHTGDGPPMQGAFPTSMWRPGDVVLDVHHLASALVRGESDQRIAVGLYNLADGSRLPAYVGGAPTPDDAVTVWPDHP